MFSRFWTLVLFFLSVLDKLLRFESFGHYASLKLLLKWTLRAKKLPTVRVGHFSSKAPTKNKSQNEMEFGSPIRLKLGWFLFPYRLCSVTNVGISFRQPTTMYRWSFHTNPVFHVGNGSVVLSSSSSLYNLTST